MHTHTRLIDYLIPKTVKIQIRKYFQNLFSKLWILIYKHKHIFAHKRLRPVPLIIGGALNLKKGGGSMHWKMRGGQYGKSTKTKKVGGA